MIWLHIDIFFVLFCADIFFLYMLLNLLYIYFFDGSSSSLLNVHMLAGLLFRLMAVCGFGRVTFIRSVLRLGGRKMLGQVWIGLVR